MKVSTHNTYITDLGLFTLLITLKRHQKHSEIHFNSAMAYIMKNIPPTHSPSSACQAGICAEPVLSVYRQIVFIKDRLS